ncbi:hypothetical protein OsJ_29017 [Oryza sativa Japonica Group]|nr:hypothetical protein OsJ_29017 [Oryza sativa Japonica Group]
MMYRETFADEVGHIRKSFEMLEGANVQQVIPEAAGGYAQDREQDERWDLLRRRHGVQARSAAQIHLCRGHRREATLLHFVVQEMTLSSAAEAADIAAGLAAELTNVRKTATVDLDVLTTSVSGPSHGLSQIKELIGSDLSGYERNQCFARGLHGTLP